MTMEGEFFLVQVVISETSSSFIICPDPENATANYDEQAKYHKQVRLLRCEITEIVREQS